MKIVTTRLPTGHRAEYCIDDYPHEVEPALYEFVRRMNKYQASGFTYEQWAFEAAKQEMLALIEAIST